VIGIEPVLAPDGFVVLRVSGRIDGTYVATLRESMEKEKTTKSGLAIDLTEVTATPSRLKLGGSLPRRAMHFAHTNALMDELEHNFAYGSGDSDVCRLTFPSDWRFIRC